MLRSKQALWASRRRQEVLRGARVQRDSGVSGAEYVPQKRYVEALAPRTSKCDLIWKGSHCSHCN